MMVTNTVSSTLSPILYKDIKGLDIDVELGIISLIALIGAFAMMIYNHDDELPRYIIITVIGHYFGARRNNANTYRKRSIADRGVVPDLPQSD